MRVKGLRPVPEQLGPTGDFDEAADDHDGVQEDVRGADEDRDADRLAEPAQEDAREYGEERERDRHLVALEKRPEIRVLAGVLGGVGRGQRHRDHEVRRRESEEREHEQLVLPAGQEALEHRDGALTDVGMARDLAVDRHRPEKRDENEETRREGRERTGGEERDAGLIAERREVVDAGQPEDAVPGVRLLGTRRGGDPSGRGPRPPPTARLEGFATRSARSRLRRARLRARATQAEDHQEVRDDEEHESVERERLGPRQAGLGGLESEDRRYEPARHEGRDRVALRARQGQRARPVQDDDRRTAPEDHDGDEQTRGESRLRRKARPADDHSEEDEEERPHEERELVREALDADAERAEEGLVVAGERPAQETRHDDGLVREDEAERDDRNRRGPPSVWTAPSSRSTTPKVRTSP